MSAVTMHHFSGLAAPFVRSKGTVSGGVFNRAILTNAQDLRTYGTNEFISSVERGAAHFNDLKGDSGFSRIMTQKLYRMRFSIAEGLRMLDAVRAQTQQ